MYTVILDGNTLHDARIEDLTINDAKLSLEVNKAGAFDFTIYPSHPIYGSIKKLKSIVELYQDGVLLFRGRVLNDTMRFDKSAEVICEGDLAYFNDSILRPYNFNGSIEDYLTMMIDSHNAQVEVDKQFTLGNVTVADANNYITRSSINHVKTWEELKNKLIDNLGGYILVRRVGNINYLDYLIDSPYMSTQTIELGENLLDVIKETRADDIVTALIPLGANLKDEEGNETETRLTIESVNGGLDYIHDVDAVAQYGYIFDTVTYDNVTVASNLLSKAQQDLAIRINLGVSVELKAIDLSMIDNVDEIRIFEYVQVTSQPHDIDTMALITKLSIDLLNPQNNTFTFGFNYQTFTDKQIQSDKVLKEIKADYVTNQQVTNAINTIELTPGPATYTWIRYADDINGIGISNDPTGKTYIGFAYNKLTAAESNIASDYTWSLIQGPKGDTGVKGDTGADGQTFYTWIKYSDNADGEGLYDIPKASTLYIGIATNKTTATESTVKTDYIWSKFKGDTGPQGPQGVEGPKGADGKATYTWIRYADTASGEGISNNPTGKEYIGLAHNKDTITESNTPSDYTWSLIRGEQGNQGVEGPKGDDGVTTYTWIKYSANANGSELTDTPQVNTAYIGIATNKTTPNESDTPNDYTWSLFKGPKGDTGYTPIKGVDYFDGIDGQDGKGIVSSIVRYQNHTNGTTAPTGTWAENPSPIKGQYLWTRTVTTYTEGDPVTTYSVAYQAIDGTDGTDGRGIVSTVVDYVKSTTATMPSTGWSTTRPTVNKGEYLWTRTTINYTSGSPSVSISNSYVPTDGQNGTSSYLWVRYSQNSNGNPMATSPVDARYIGVATTSTSTAPTGYASYSWSLIKGQDGVQGETGQDGQTSYLHIKYSNDGGTTFTSNGGETVGDWIGTYVDFIEADSNKVNDYTWNRVKGDKGEKGETGAQGVQGPKGDNGVSQYVHIRYSANSTGNPMTPSPQATTKYIGLANTTSSTAPTGYASYTWSLVKGSDGVDGITGPAGEDGNPNYTWVKYADNELGENMSDYPSGKMYIGLAFNKITNTESSDPLDYQWSAMYDLEALADVENRVTSAIIQTAEQIRTEVAETYVSTGSLDEYKSEVSTQFTQTSDQFNFNFNNLQTEVTDLESETQIKFTEIDKYIRFKDGNIELGDSTSQIKLVIENDIIRFMQNGVSVAYIDNNTLYITDGQFLNSLRIGNFAFTPRANGNLSFGKVV